MSVEATIRGHGLRLTLRIDGYEDPAAQTGTDSDWLTAVIDLEVGVTGRFRAHKQLTPFAPELEAFRDQLRALDRDQTGQARLAHLEDEFELTITLVDGKGTIAGYVREHIGASLSFDEIEIDQTHVREALKQFVALADAFPSRGISTER
jgi:hypothetical protein